MVYTVVIVRKPSKLFNNSSNCLLAKLWLQPYHNGLNCTRKWLVRQKFVPKIFLHKDEQRILSILFVTRYFRESYCNSSLKRFNGLHRSYSFTSRRIVVVCNCQISPLQARVVSVFSCSNLNEVITSL